MPVCGGGEELFREEKDSTIMGDTLWVIQKGTELSVTPLENIHDVSCIKVHKSKKKKRQMGDIDFGQTFTSSRKGQCSGFFRCSSCWSQLCDRAPCSVCWSERQVVLIRRADALGTLSGFLLCIPRCPRPSENSYPAEPRGGVLVLVFPF